MAEPYRHDGVIAPGYPGTGSEIMTDATGFGYMEGCFEHAIQDHGNGGSATWPSSLDPEEEFKITYDGRGITVVEGSTWGTWLLEFKKAEGGKVLAIDIAAQTVQRWTGDGFQPGSFKDNSDVIAAVINLQAYDKQRRAEGWDPDTEKLRLLEFLLGVEGGKDGNNN